MEIIKTKRLVIILAEMKDLVELELIEKECKTYFTFDPICKKKPDWSIRECLTKKDIPFDGIKENYFFYCIRQNNELIGSKIYKP